MNLIDLKSNTQEILLGYDNLFLNIIIVAFCLRYPLFAGFHNYACLLIGLLWAIRKNNPLSLIIIISYISGSEIVWRMAHAPILYESGKYYICLLTVLGILKFTSGRTLRLPFILYILLLIPSLLIIPEFNRKIKAFFN